jgi:hypothetical protein
VVSVLSGVRSEEIFGSLLFFLSTKTIGAPPPPNTRLVSVACGSAAAMQRTRVKVQMATRRNRWPTRLHGKLRTRRTAALLNLVETSTHTKFWSENLMGKDRFGNLSVNKRIILVLTL